MSVKLERAFAPTSREEIHRFEMRRGIVLPQEYRNFLLQSNGGAPEPDSFDVPGWTHKASGMQRFFGIRKGDVNDLDRTCEVYRDRIPNELLPIASDSFGNIIAIGIRGQRRAKIYFWDHEDELDENGLHRQDYSNVFLLANSIDEFLNKLYEYKEE